jgi:hypothetical protein
MIKILTGFIVVTSSQEKYVNEPKENTHDESGKLYKSIFLIKVEHRPTKLAQSGNCNKTHKATTRSDCEKLRNN